MGVIIRVTLLGISPTGGETENCGRTQVYGAQQVRGCHFAQQVKVALSCPCLQALLRYCRRKQQTVAGELTKDWNGEYYVSFGHYRVKEYNKPRAST
jgi:hypothetical protein